MLSLGGNTHKVLYFSNLEGSNARALEKSKTLAADSLILDLEDAVAPNAKDMARELVSKAVASGGFGGREVWCPVLTEAMEVELFRNSLLLTV